MKIGAAYYPEYRKEEDWPSDFEKMKKAGIKRIRMGEFAWSRIEPEEGVFNWDWMDRAIDMAGQYGIDVMIGTPTATPPAWLVEKYPEVLPVGSDGRKVAFGARQHRCYNSPVYIEYAAKIVETLAKRYGSHPNVAAWQIDNELGAETKRCRCANCSEAFQKYLFKKYGNLEELNERWGNHFWSQDFQKWEQIPLPGKFASDLSMKSHPSLELEFSRFSSDSIIRFCNMQSEIIRKYSKDRIITTNTDMFTWGDNQNLVNLFKDMDVCGIDVYTKNLYEVAFYSDLARSIKRNSFWMTEFGTGSNNLVNDMAEIRDRDCEWMMLFKFNPFPWGQEQGHNGLLSMTGKPTESYEIVEKWTEGGVYKGRANNKNIEMVGVMYDFDSSWTYLFSSWETNIEKKQVYPNYMVHVLYKSLFDEGIPVQFVFDERNIEKLNTIIMPFQIIYNPALEDKLIEFVEGGGKLVINTDFFQKNVDNVYLTSVPKIYKVFFGDSQDDFIYETKGAGSTVLIKCQVGMGQVWMVRTDTSAAEWKLLMKEVMD